MAQSKQEMAARWFVPYFDGTNSNVSHSISKKTELYHTENANSPVIGAIAKRQGTRRLGSEMTATANYGLEFFENSGTNGFYRISAVSGTRSIYYLNGSAVWTALTGHGTSLSAAQFSSTIAEGCCFLVNNTDNNRYIDSAGTQVYSSADIGDSTTQFDITNPTGTTIRYTYDSTGTNPNLTSNIKIGNIIHITASGFNVANQGWFVVTDVTSTYFEVANASGVVESNKVIGTGVIRTNNHLTGSPKANKINYFKDRLYLADYTIGTTRYKNGILMSSEPLGIVSLVDGDHTAPITSLVATETKYIKSDDVLDVYRNGTFIGTVVVTAKNTDTNTLTINSFGTNIKSSDELWVGGTYSGTRVFRWVDSPDSGVDVKLYDTFKISGGQNDRIKMFTNIGDNMVIGNNSNLGFWNGTSMVNSDAGVGCVSDVGYTKVAGFLFFVHYKGLYSLAPTMNTPQLLSSPIQRMFDGATTANLEASAVGAKGFSVVASLGDVTLYYPDGSIDKTMSSALIEYDLRKKNWYQHTNIKATQFATYKTSTNSDRLEYASTDTDYEIRELFTGNVDDAVSAGTEIPFRIDTNRIVLGKSFENICYVEKIILETSKGAGVKVFISLDDAPFYEILGETNKGLTILKMTAKDTNITQPVRCRTIQISLRENSKKSCIINQLALVYTETTENENDKIESHQ